MDKTILERFFRPIKPVEFKKKPDYKKLEGIKPLLNGMSDIMSHNSYIIDYYKKEFYFISRNSIFLCGYSEEEVMNWGYEFYGKIISPDDLSKLEEINTIGFNIFYQASPEKRPMISIAYDLILHSKDGHRFAIRHGLKPFLFAPDGNIWMAICSVSHSSSKKMGNIILSYKHINENYTIDLDKKTINLIPPIILTESEQIIIKETERGSLEKQIAVQLGITTDTIHYYKKKLIKKTHSKSFTEAIAYLKQNDFIK